MRLPYVSILALASLAAPVAAETVDITCRVQRNVVDTGRSAGNSDFHEWRFSVDLTAPTVTWLSGWERMNEPTGGSWLRREPATASPAGDGLVACLVDTDVCGETIDADVYRETVAPAQFSPGLGNVRMMVTMLFANGRRQTEVFSGSCS